MIGNCTKNMSKFRKELYDHLKISKLLIGEVTFYLKAKCIKLKERIFMTQKAYTYNILVTFGMENYTLATTHTDKKIKTQDRHKKERRLN